METIWILVADKHRLRVFEIEKTRNFREVVDFLSPEGRMRMQIASENAYEAATAKIFPRSGDDNGASTSLSQDDELFSKQISNYVENARRGRRFTKMRIVAPLDFLIILRKNMSKGTKRSIEGEVVHALENVESINFEDFLRSIAFSAMKKTQWSR